MLCKTPIIQIVCERTEISRATYYRWRKEDLSFLDAAEQALNQGIELVNDLAEATLINNIKSNNMTAITYWLSHRKKEYRPKTNTFKLEYGQRLTNEEARAIRRATIDSKLYDE